MDQPSIPERAIRVLADNHEIPGSQRDQNLRLVVLDVGGLSGHELDDSVGMPRCPIETDESITLGLEVSEGQSASIVDHHVESICINTSTLESELGGELREFIEPVLHSKELS